MLELVQVAVDRVEKYPENQNKIVMESLTKIIVEKTTLITDESSGKINTDYANLLKTDKRLKELIAWRYNEKKWPVQNLVFLRERCDSLLEMIDMMLKDK
jgi:uncharacterized membrane protein YgaE (UPF0421/DUF939 family)